MKLQKIFNQIEGIDESILDPPQKEKQPLWLVDENDHFNPEIKKQIYRILRKWRDQINFKFDIDAILLKGSILTPRRTEDSDADITVKTSMTKEQRDSIIEIVPRGNKIIVDGIETQHPLDFYILAKDEETPERNLDAIFDVGNDEWIKKPDVDYKLDIPLNYAVEVSNFFINGATIAITNYDTDKSIYEFYKGLDPETQDIEKEEKDKALVAQRKKLQADYDALNVCQHMLSAFRHEAYDDDPQPFKISVELTNDNPHNTMNEVMLKLFEKIGLRQKLKDKSEECGRLLEDDKPHEEK
jgi:predicted nucleotidyltransferase